jgi:hypothetical protein
MTLDSFYQPKQNYYSGGNYFGFGIRNINWLPICWIWCCDYRENKIIPQKHSLQFIFSIEPILKSICKKLDIFKGFYRVKIKHD